MSLPYKEYTESILTFVIILDSKYYTNKDYMDSIQREYAESILKVIHVDHELRRMFITLV